MIHLNDKKAYTAEKNIMPEIFFYLSFITQDIL